jgi:adenylate cyclase
MFGELVPFGGGDPIPLMKSELLVGRRESCDIVLRFSNVSAHHCELMVEQGYWFVKDLNSRNGTKVNGLRVTAKKRIDPGDRLSVAKHHYELRYSPAELGAEGPPPDETALGEILGQSLMKSAGLDRRKQQEQDRRVGRPTAPPAELAEQALEGEDDAPVVQQSDVADDVASEDESEQPVDESEPPAEERADEEEEATDEKPDA